MMRALQMRSTELSPRFSAGDISSSPNAERWLMRGMQPRASQNMTFSIMLRFEPRRPLHATGHFQASSEERP